MQSDLRPSLLLLGCRSQSFVELIQPSNESATYISERPWLVKVPVTAGVKRFRGCLTAAGLVVVVEGEVCGAAADEAADGDGEAEVGAVSVGGGAGVPASLSGRVKHQDVHDVVQVALDDGAVLTAGLVGPLDAALAPVSPVDVVLVLGEAERVREVVSYHLTLQT